MDKFVKVEDVKDLLNGLDSLPWEDEVEDMVDKLVDDDIGYIMHGKWETGHFEGGIFDGTNFEKCNVCQFERLFDDIRFKTTYNYCPNCGAKMDLKEGAE